MKRIANTLRTMSTNKTYKVLIAHTDVPEEGLKLLREKCEVIRIVNDYPKNRAEILEKIKGVHAAIWGGRDLLNAEVLDAAGPQFKVVSTMSSGINNVDVPELKKRGIPLGSTPAMLVVAVADLAVGLLIAAARRFQEGRRKIDSNNWETHHRNWMLGQDIQDSTVGFYGFGGIGQAIAKRLSGFEIGRVLYTTRSRVSEDIEKKFNATKVDFDTLLAESDFVVIASPLTPETEGLFNATAFNKMKTTSVLVNIGRGKIVNQDDLYEALKSNRIFAAGLDVMVPEPLRCNDKLLALDNVVVTPHVGYATKRTRVDAASLAAQNILKGLAGEPMPSPAY
ncbi:glyoxylate reductase/hydroxypyruvate reductase [Drosophila bipectinata]|uniref:glyoxylate reductase/hydroxypyruvate reductase n=1 Tax=Drosophila bipectinata TaxID=42026 RepID=UPI001C891CCC|nr:glyoxylate reductase/hydroxypyruvate reductase [Drosophila bipectinata]